MSIKGLDILIVFLLIILNGMFAMAEIAITVIGVLSGAFGGATIAAHLEEVLDRAPLPAP